MIATPITGVTNVTPPVDSVNTLMNVPSNPSDIAGMPVIAAGKQQQLQMHVQL